MPTITIWPDVAPVSDTSDPSAREGMGESAEKYRNTEVRLVAAVFVFDVRPYLVNPFWRMGYYATNVVFACLPVIYALAAVKGGAL